MRLSREFAVLTSDQVLNGIAKVSGQRDAETQGAVLRALVNADILQTLPRSSDLQLNAYVLEFVRGLTQNMSWAWLPYCRRVLRPSVKPPKHSMKGCSGPTWIACAEPPTSWQNSSARSACSSIRTGTRSLNWRKTLKAPTAACRSAQRYREVLEAYDHYVEPMNQMMDSGSQGTFYRYLEEAGVRST